MQVVNAKGQVLGSQSYTPYGSIYKQSGITPAFGYAGMYQHTPSGLNLTWYRAYSPSTARWLSKDPIEEAGGLNLYGYVNKNPIINTDPKGLNPAAAAGCAAGAWAGCPIGCGVGVAIGTGIVIAIPLFFIPSDTAKDDACTDDGACPPCRPYPVGTIGYRLDRVPPSKPHYPLKGDHVHLFKMNQNPKTCQCFWNKLTVIEPPPPGAVPL